MPIVDNSVDKVDNSAKRRFFSQSQPAIGLFAKQPRPGQVKTRLTPPLTPEQASELYQVALRETVVRLQSAGFVLTICYAGDKEWFAGAFPGLPLIEQRGAGLGERMTNAVAELFAQGGGPVLLAGSDNPDLPVTLVQKAVELLQEHDVVTIPCSDGGYNVVGLRAETTAVFAGIPWSTGGVVAKTRRRCQELELSYRETDGWHDIDEVADLISLVGRSPASMTAQHIISKLANIAELRR